MKYTNVEKRSPKDFKRLTGVTKKVFGFMVEDVAEANKKVRIRGGSRKGLCAEDQVLLTLSYWREYRTLFHIAHDYEVSEPTASRTIRFVEDALCDDPRFHLPGKKALRGDGLVIEAIVVDASESPVERPKRKKNQKTA